MATKRLTIDENKVLDNQNNVAEERCYITFGRTINNTLIRKSNITLVSGDKLFIELTKSSQSNVSYTFKINIYKYNSGKVVQSKVSYLVSSLERTNYLDVTNFVENGNLSILIEGEQIETDNTVDSTVTYYPRNTFTIYPPILHLKTNDYAHTPATNTTVIEAKKSALWLENYLTIPKNTTMRLNISASPRSIIRQFLIKRSLQPNYILEPGCYFGIKDLDSDTYVIYPDPIYTRVKCDSTGSFITIHTHEFYEKQPYQVELFSPDGVLIVNRTSVFNVI